MPVNEWVVPSSKPQAPLRPANLLLLLLAGSGVVAAAYVLSGSFVLAVLLAALGWFAYGNAARLEARARPDRSRSRWNVRPLSWTVFGGILALTIMVAGWLVIGSRGEGALSVWTFAGFVLACEVPEWLWLAADRRWRRPADPDAAG